MRDIAELPDMIRFNLRKELAVKEPKKPKTVEIVDSDYTPTKAEMEEEFALRSDSVDVNDIDSVMGALGKAMTQRVNFRRIKKPRSRQSP